MFFFSVSSVFLVILIVSSCQKSDSSVTNVFVMIILALVFLESFLIELIFLCKKKKNKANNELITLFTKVIYLQKTLNQMNCHATEKINCFAVELNSNNDETENKNNSFNI